MSEIIPVKTLWKSMQAGMKSSYGDIKWKIGKWEETKGEIEKCSSGFHASENIVDAMGFVNCEVLALVEVAGAHDIEDDKEAWEKMRIVKAYHWDKEASVKMAIFSAETCISIFEKEYPHDDRPRKAIQAAKKWLEEPTKEGSEAARAAWAAEAWAARAAWAAARAAEAAARAAEAAARAAEANKDTIHNYIINEIIPTLKPYAV